MNKRLYIFKVLFVHSFVNLIAFLIFTINENIILGGDRFNELMTNEMSRFKIYLIYSIISFVLYFISSKVFLNKMSRKKFIKSASLLVGINLLLCNVGFLITHFGTGHIAENGLAFIIIFCILNFAIMPLSAILNSSFMFISEILRLSIISFIPLLYLWIGRLGFKNDHEF